MVSRNVEKILQAVQALNDAERSELILFLDSGAVAKRYVAEQGSQWMRTMLDPAAGNEVYRRIKNTCRPTDLRCKPRGQARKKSGPF